MNAPILWIILPAIAAVALYVARRWQSAVRAAGIGITLALAWLAWLLPINQSFSLRLWAGFPIWKIAPDLSLLGGRLELTDASRPWLTMIYLAVGFWFGGAFATRSERLFIPTGLGIAVALTASLAISPGVYAGLIIAMTSLMCVPILSPPGVVVQRGVWRFLVFQISGVCLVLLASWSLVTYGAPEGGFSALPLEALITSLGFALLLGLFPFHTWLPMLAEKANPYAAAFIFYVLPNSILFLVIHYLNRYQLLGLAQSMYIILGTAGLLSVLAGGILAFFEQHLGRMLGYAAMTQVGMALIAISLGGDRTGTNPAAGIYYAQLLPQGIGLALWALALSTLRERVEDLSFARIAGLARSMPLAAVVLALANFSLAGMPLLASFPVNMAIWGALSQRSLAVALLSMAGNVGLLAGGVRALAVLIGTQESAWQFSERGLVLVLLILGSLMLFVIGFMPQWFIPTLTRLGLDFSSLAR